MPDTRTHRGAHPEDLQLFATDRLPTLRRGMEDLCWLLDHGYAMRSSLALVGDRYNLSQRQRLALARSACAAEDRDHRKSHQIGLGDLAGSDVWIDGYNLLITIEAALGGGVILEGRDGSFRDLASLHGTYRSVDETEPAAELIGGMLAQQQVHAVRWILDRPVSNSGRLRERLLALAVDRGWKWDVDLEFSPDAVLSRTENIVATSDSIVLNQCGRWFNAAREIITTRVPGAFVIRWQASTLHHAE